MLKRSLIEYLKERGFKYGIKVLKRVKSPNLLVEVNGDVKRAEVEVQTSRYNRPDGYADLVIAWEIDKPLTVPVIQIDHDDFRLWENSQNKLFKASETKAQNPEKDSFLPYFMALLKWEKDEIVDRLETLRTNVYKMDAITFYGRVFPLILEDRGVLTVERFRMAVCKNAGN
ncbi:MAG: hypothetical protein QW778_01970 [Candidatus Micrarchaeaceae archaeon]